MLGNLYNTCNHYLLIVAPFYEFYGHKIMQSRWHKICSLHYRQKNRVLNAKRGTKVETKKPIEDVVLREDEWTIHSVPDSLYLLDMTNE